MENYTWTITTCNPCTHEGTTCEVVLSGNNPVHAIAKYLYENPDSETFEFLEGTYENYQVSRSRLDTYVLRDSRSKGNPVVSAWSTELLFNFMTYAEEPSITDPMFLLEYDLYNFPTYSYSRGICVYVQACSIEKAFNKFFKSLKLYENEYRELVKVTHHLEDGKSMEFLRRSSKIYGHEVTGISEWELEDGRYEHPGRRYRFFHVTPDGNLRNHSNKEAYKTKEEVN